MSSAAPIYVRPLRRRSIAGPLVLIILGLLFLAKNLGAPISLFAFFARWWPLLLVLAGAIRLFEYYQAQRTNTAVPRIGGGAVFLMVLLVVLGLGASGIYRSREHINWGEVREEVQMDPDFMRMFGSDHTFEEQVEQEFAPGSQLKVVCERGSITVNAWDENKIKVLARKNIFASNDQEAQRRHGQTKPQISVTGGVVMVNANTQGAGDVGVRTDLEIFVPRQAAIDLASRRGDIMVSNRAGEVKISMHRGDVRTEDIEGNVFVTVERSNLHAARVKGDITVSGRANDVVLVDVTGAATFNSDIFGELKLSKIGKGVRFNSSRTELELAKLDGDLDMDSGDLRITEAQGLRLNTRSKDINLTSMSGDVKVDTDNGDISLASAQAQPLGNVVLSNRHGEIRLELPSNAGFEFQGSTRHGEVSSEFGEITVNTSDKNSNRATGKVGRGGAKIQVSTDSGDISIRKVG